MSTIISREQHQKVVITDTADLDFSRIPGITSFPQNITSVELFMSADIVLNMRMNRNAAEPTKFCLQACLHAPKI